MSEHSNTGHHLANPKTVLEHFLKDLRAPTGAPGGGAASAVAASMGCALYQMVAGVTLNLPRFTQGRERLKVIHDAASSCCDEFAHLAARDAKAYVAVEKTLKMPRTSPEEKQARRRAMQDAMKGATTVPLEIVEKCAGCLGLLPDLVKYGNPNAITDVAVGSLLLEAALKGAAMNAEINLVSISDSQFADSAGQRLEESREKMAAVWPALESAAKGAGITL